MAVTALVVPRRVPRDDLTAAVATLAVAAGVCVLLATEAGHAAGQVAGQVAGHVHDVEEPGLGVHLPHVAMVVAMTAVMMGPFAVPLAAAVSRSTVWWRSGRAVAATLVAYLGLWALTAGGLHVAGELLAAVATPAGAVGGLTALVVAEQLSRRRGQVLAACQATRPVRAESPVRGGAAWGLLAAVRCVRACALPMALMAVAPGVVTFAGVTALLWAERFGPRPRPRTLLASGYLVVGAAQVWTAIVQE